MQGAHARGFVGRQRGFDHHSSSLLASLPSGTHEVSPANGNPAAASCVPLMRTAPPTDTPIHILGCGAQNVGGLPQRAKSLRHTG